MDVDEGCIQEAIGQFYSFFGQMVRLKSDIDQLSLDNRTKHRIFRQLEEIEKEYKYSQEWFMTRDVQDVRVGVVGSERSLKTAVVSLFVEGVLEIEGDERDGRSKSKINVDGKCKLLLIREETGAPSKQLCHWADVLIFVFSYSDDESLLQVVDYHRIFRELNQEAPVMLVGVKDEGYSFRRQVREGDVKKTADLLEKCYEMDVGLTQQSTYTLFAQACKLALTSSAISNPPKFVTPSTLQCPNSYSATTAPISQGLVAAGVQKFGGAQPTSPSHVKRMKQRRSMFGGKQGTYGVSKPSDTFGSGRPVPFKEGQVNKKSTGGLRAEWKRKYLILSQDELTYYPSLNDYMSKAHGKSLKLQQITVKVPGQRVSSVSKTPSEHTHRALPPDLLQSLNTAGNQSDRSNSGTPPPGGLESSLDVSYSSALSGAPRPGLLVTLPPNGRDHRSPLSPDDDFGSSDHFDDVGLYNPAMNHKYNSHMTNGRGHNRNSSFDENVMMLQQLRTGGISYPPIEEDRSATMPRLDTKKTKVRHGNLLSTLQGSEEFISGGSQDSLGQPEKQDRKKKGNKDRNSFLVERTASESSKDRPVIEKKAKSSHKRQRSWGGNKLLEVEMGGDTPNESCEFHVFSADNKVWCFEANSLEDAAAWVKAIEDQIKKTISESVSHKRVNSSNDTDKKEILTTEGNNFCADCSSPNPEWASLNHGCVLCIECSGVHRNLGTHISRIRSLELDEWSPELISVMLQIGNKMSRNLWEAKKPKNRPTHSTPREERERFIKSKYIDKEFLADLPYSGKPIYEQLMETVRSNNIRNCLNILAHASLEDINHLHGPPESWAALHAACKLGRTVISQLLIWNGGDVNILDGEKHSPLYYARSFGHGDISSILLANSCTDEVSDTSV